MCIAVIEVEYLPDTKIIRIIILQLNCFKLTCDELSAVFRSLFAKTSHRPNARVPESQGCQSDALGLNEASRRRDLQGQGKVLFSLEVKEFL